MESMAQHVEAMLDSSGAELRCSITATTCASGPTIMASRMPLNFPGFVPAYIRPLFCEGKGPFRWVALSGDPRGYLPHR